MQIDEQVAVEYHSSHSTSMPEVPIQYQSRSVGLEKKALGSYKHSSESQPNPSQTPMHKLWIQFYDVL